MDKGRSFEDNHVQVLTRDVRWFKRGVKEAIYDKLENPEEAIHTWLLTNPTVSGEVSTTCIMRGGATNTHVTEAPNVLMAAEE